ncbi:MAG: hypothetical protein Q8O38_03345 [Sulfurimicrobium sp.]|nr:hypothetical protein [Sulfurimicrobium sp.]
MLAIEFDTVVQAHSIPLPARVVLAPGLPVRVVVMYEETGVPPVGASQGDAISALCANPLVVSDFVPLSRDEAHER